MNMHDCRLTRMNGKPKKDSKRLTNHKLRRTLAPMTSLIFGIIAFYALFFWILNRMLGRHV